EIFACARGRAQCEKTFKFAVSGTVQEATKKARMLPCEPSLHWCPREDSNLHACRRYHLKVVRLPIPPPGQGFVKSYQFFFGSGFSPSFFSGAAGASVGAGLSEPAAAGAAGTSDFAGAACCFAGSCVPTPLMTPRSASCFSAVGCR